MNVKYYAKAGIVSNEINQIKKVDVTDKTKEILIAENEIETLSQEIQKNGENLKSNILACVLVTILMSVVTLLFIQDKAPIFGVIALASGIMVIGNVYMKLRNNWKEEQMQIRIEELYADIEEMKTKQKSLSNEEKLALSREVIDLTKISKRNLNAFKLLLRNYQKYRRLDSQGKLEETLKQKGEDAETTKMVVDQVRNRKLN